MNEKLVFNKYLQKKHTGERILDSLQLSLAGIYHQLHFPDSCRLTLLKIGGSNKFSVVNYQLYLAMLLVNGEIDMVRNKIKDRQTGVNFFPGNTALSIRILKREPLQEGLLQQLPTSPEFLEIKKRYERTPRFSPFLAGLYSTLLPGLGKAYCGSPLQGITAFAANALLGVQAAESYVKSGPVKPRFIITASLFGLFYMGNIWGSVALARKKKHDHLKQLDHEILDYYHTIIRTYTY